MRRTRFDRAPCPIARTTDLVGDWWTPIVLREACFGCTRFEEFQERLGVSRATLAQRLNRLAREGLLDRVPYQSRPTRYEYRLTEKGRAFFDVLAAMWRWGEDWLFSERGAPVALIDRRTGEDVLPQVVDQRTGRQIELSRLGLRIRKRPPRPPEAEPTAS